MKRDFGRREWMEGHGFQMTLQNRRLLGLGDGGGGGLFMVGKEKNVCIEK
jgi:hypothetical protein